MLVRIRKQNRDGSFQYDHVEIEIKEVDKNGNISHLGSVWKVIEVVKK